jgi:protein SCO1
VPVLLATFTLASVAAGCGSSDSGAVTSASAPSPSAQAPGASGFDGAALPASVPAPEDFSLSALAGPTDAPVSLSSYRGRVVIVAFVYSTCGATCVVIAQQIRGALDELPADVPVLLISADPRSDTPARVRRFLAQTSLSGRVSYLGGTPAQLRPVWRSFRIVPASAGRAAFDRSASVYVLDRNGRERVLFQLEQLTPEGLSHDVRKLLE